MITVEMGIRTRKKIQSHANKSAQITEPLLLDPCFLETSFSDAGFKPTKTLNPRAN